MSIIELCERLAKLIDQGYGNLPVCLFNETWVGHDEINGIDIQHSSDYSPGRGKKTVTAIVAELY